MPIGTTIIHKPSGGEYCVIGHVQIKTDEGWVEGWLYQEHLNSLGRIFARPYTKFDDDWRIVEIKIV